MLALIDLYDQCGDQMHLHQMVGRLIQVSQGKALPQLMDIPEKEANLYGYLPHKARLMGIIDRVLGEIANRHEEQAARAETTLMRRDKNEEGVKKHIPSSSFVDSDYPFCERYGRVQVSTTLLVKAVP